ncbi:MAG: zinc ribbon domain-containing protein [Chloroflexi bacterium]|nr:zinc ribbon domain-containing protein [Chloroflexota bacterium]
MTIPANLLHILRVTVALIGAYVALFWITLVIWTARDIHSRTRDILAQILATLIVLVFNVPGLLLYLVLRPAETLSDAYQRSLEEEALLLDIEQQFSCPGCKRRIEADYVICPHCHTKLKGKCAHCGRLLNLNWDICPYCGQSI